MSNGAAAIPAGFGWKDQDWAELLACMRLRKVIPFIGEELLQVEIEGEMVPLYTWMAKRLASELDVPSGELSSPASLNDVTCPYLARSDSKPNSISTRLWIIMDEAKANLRAPTPLRQLAEITWSPDGKTLASGSYDQTVKLWEAATGKLLGTLQFHV
jgi:hypothetical protein